LVSRRGTEFTIVCSADFRKSDQRLFRARRNAVGLVVAVFAGIERQRTTIHFLWVFVPALLLVGVSLALPLLLYLRDPLSMNPNDMRFASGAH
jgi:Terpene cyclase DEP1